MPHLSPLNWLLAPMMFWSLFTLLSSLLWWSQTLTFPFFKKISPMFLTLPW